jgi:hypothetical protein
VEHGSGIPTFNRGDKMAESNGTRMKRIRRIFTDLSLDFMRVGPPNPSHPCSINSRTGASTLKSGATRGVWNVPFSHIPLWLILSPTYFVSIYWLKLRTNTVCIPINSCGDPPVLAGAGLTPGRSIEQKRMR